MNAYEKSIALNLAGEPAEKVATEANNELVDNLAAAWSDRDSLTYA